MYKEIIEKAINNPQDDCSQLIKISVIEILKIIQEQMTSKNDQERCKAINLMRRILQNKDYQYNEQAQELLFQFFIQKMSDTSSIVDTTYILMFIGIKSIECKNHKIINNLLNEIIENRIHIQGYNRESRINIYKIFQNLINIEITHQVISAFLKSIAGEKDPRNIMICFEILEILLSNPLIEQYSEEVFQFLDCYYPIEFQDRADPRYQLNKRDIVNKLDICLSKKVLIKKTLGMLIEKIDSQYDEAQLSAFNTLQIILNQDILDASQLDIMGDALQFITENYLSDKVIEELINTFCRIIDYAMTKEQYHKVANKVISIQFNKIQEIPNSQQALISEKLLIYCLKFNKMQILQRYIELFLRVLDHQHKPILLRRIQILLQLYDYIIEEQIEVNIQDSLMLKLKDQLIDILQKYNEEIFIITLKVQLDIQLLNKQERLNQLIETLLIDKFLNVSDITMQKCILDYFTIIGIIRTDIYEKQIERIQNYEDKELFYYSLICSFSNLPNYFMIYQQQLIQDVENEDNLIKSLLQIIKYLTNQKYITHNEELKIKQQDQINSIILQWINLDKIEKITNKELQKLIKSLFIVFYSKCQNQQILCQIQQIFTFQNIINLKDQIVYYYIRLILHEKSKQQQQDLIYNICQYLKLTKFDQKDSEKKQRRQIYKLILKLIININIDEYETFLQNFLESQFDFDQNGFSQKMLQGVIIIIGITQNNQKYFQYLNNIKFEQNLRLFRDILRHITNNNVNYHQYLLMLYLKYNSEYPKSQRITLNHIDFSLLNLELSESNLIIKEIIKTIPIQCQYISIQKELDQLIQLSDKYQKGNTVNILQGLLNLFQDQNIIKEIIYQIGYRLSELQYNVSLCQQVISQIQAFLSHQKRVVRKAAQYTINELYLISK